MEENISETLTPSDIQSSGVISENTNDDLINDIKAKHEEKNLCREKPTDIFFAQITICIIILLIITAANIIKAGSAEAFARNFSEMTDSEPEKIIQNAVSQAIKLIRP